MKNIKLDSIILFTLVIPFIMGYRISPFESEYWVFGIVFFLLLVYIGLDLLSLRERLYAVLKNSILFVLLLIILGGSFFHTIVTRNKNHPIYGVHDIIIQQEIAVQSFLVGKNPYAITYFDSAMEQWHYSDFEINPALYHFVMQPFYVLFAVPFYLLSIRTIGFFDGRFPLLFLFAFILFVGYVLVKDGERKRLFISLLAFHPAILPYTLEGRSDLFMYAFLFGGLVFLHKKKYFLSAVPLALAFATKQSAWLLMPFYVAYLFFTLREKLKISLVLGVFAVIFGAVTLPFFFWDQNAFVASTISFLNGTTKHSYPIAGYGLGGTLVELGLIGDKHAFYPFYLWQAVFCGPLLVVLLLYLKKSPTVQRLIVGYGIFLFVFWYFSRYFHNSHLAYISYIFLAGYFWPEEKKSEVEQSKKQRKPGPKPKGRRFVTK